MKIIFMGTPELAVSALDGLFRSKHEITAVVTQPDRESGRGRKTSFSPVKTFALENGLEVMQPEDISGEKILDELEALKADIFVVVAYAQKIPERLLNMAPYGCINVHPSLLPKYRGAAPLRGPILNGDPTFGISIMRLCDRWDAGDILLQKEYPVDAEDTTESLELKVRALCAGLLLETMDGLEAGSIVPVKQDDAGASYIKQIKKEEGRIDFGEDAVQIERQIRACVPWPSAYTAMNGKVFKIWKAECVDALSSATDPSAPEGADCGEVVFVDKKNLVVKCGSGLLGLKEVQLEGKKRMDVSDFLRGSNIEKGFVFGS